MRRPLRIEGPSPLKLSRKILIVRIRSLGDCVLTTPAIRILKHGVPDAEIGVVVEPDWRAVFEGNPDVAQILPPTHRAVWEFKPDLCIDLHGGTTAARLTFFSGAKRRAGFNHFRKRAAYNIRIPTAQKILHTSRVVHTAEHLATAMFYLGMTQREVPRARLFADPPKVIRQPYAVIHPVAATGEKTWPAAGFRRVAQHLREHHQLNPIFIAAKDQDLSGFDGFETMSGAPLGGIKTLISGATLFVGNDSGPAHIAAAFGVPPAVIFGPSDPKIWGPWGTPGEVVQAEGPIADVPAERVIAAVDRLRVAA